MIKIYSTAAIFAVMAFVGCKGSDSATNAQYAPAGAANATAAYKYLADADTSAATTDASSSDSSASTAVDSTVSSDIVDSRVADMASRMLKDLDADSSGALSLDEFLGGPDKIAAKANDAKLKALSDDLKAKMKEKLTSEFNSFAGDDAQLSLEELKTLLVAQAPRIAEFRRGGPGMPPKPRARGPLGGPAFGKGPQGPQPRQMPSEDELFKKYDTNGDGQLDASEFKAMLQARFKVQPPVSQDDSSQN